MITPVGFKNRVSFGYDFQGNGKSESSKKFSHETSYDSKEKNAFLYSNQGVISDYINSLIDEGYDYTAACDKGDKFARCLKSHENV